MASRRPLGGVEVGHWLSAGQLFLLLLEYTILPALALIRLGSW